MINQLNIQRANAILKNAIEDGRPLTAEEMILLEKLTRDESDDNATNSQTRSTMVFKCDRF